MDQTLLPFISSLLETVRIDKRNHTGLNSSINGWMDEDVWKFCHITYYDFQMVVSMVKSKKVKGIRIFLSIPMD